MSCADESERNVSLEVLCKNIQSSEKSVRHKALEELLEIVSKQTNDDDLKKLLEQTYLHLIKCYTDRFETIRCLAISVVSQFLNNFQIRNDFFLEYIIPIIRRRIGLPEMIEGSEELQLKLLEQIEGIVDKFRANEADFLMRSFNDIIDIVVRNLSNKFANAHRQCCKVIRVLATATPSFCMRAETLIDPLIELLLHRQSATRITATETLGVVCLHVNNKNDKLVKSIVSISPLLTDSVAGVRVKCGIVGCQWLMKLPDRYSFFERIVPLVLCCLKDELTEIQTEINALFIECGKKYFEENEKELQRIELIDHEFPCSNYIETVAKERPTLGCRALVQRSLRMVDILLKEMLDWKEPVRLHSLKLLWEVVLFAEKSFTCKFMEVFPVLAKTCQDDEKSVVRESLRVAFLMGRLLDYNDWMTHAMRNLKKYPNSLGILRCFNSLFAGSEMDLKKASVEDISKLISSSDMCHNLNDTFQGTLLDVIEQLVDIYLNEMGFDSDVKTDGEIILNGEKYLFEILVKTIALSNAHENGEIPERGIALYNKFCRTKKNRIVMQGKYMADVINNIEDLDCEHSDRSERIIMLFGCIKLCGFQKEYFHALQTAIQMVIEHSNANAQIKILSGVSMAFLNWNQENMEEEAMDILSEFIKTTIEPLLIWKAGRNAESIRAMATQALYSIGCSCTNEARKIFPNLAKHFIALVEDEVAVTRAYAIRCVLKSGPFCFQDYRQLTIDILNRLDDPCANVRCLAIECLSQMKVEKSDPDFSEMNYANLAETTISRLILYFDDPFIKLRPILMDSLSMLAERHPKEFENEVNKLPSNFLYKSEIDKLKEECFESKK